MDLGRSLRTFFVSCFGDTRSLSEEKLGHLRRDCLNSPRIELPHCSLWTRSYLPGWWWWICMPFWKAPASARSELSVAASASMRNKGIINSQLLLLFATNVNHCLPEQ